MIYFIRIVYYIELFEYDPINFSSYYKLISKIKRFEFDTTASFLECMSKCAMNVMADSTVHKYEFKNEIKN